jgi:hypothetical protein
MAKARLARMALSGAVALGALAVALAPAPASARVFVRFGLGLPLVAPIYPAPYSYPPAYYYYPPAAPAYYVPPASAAPAAPAASAGTATGNCREYSTTTVIQGQAQPTYGTACLQADGTWHIVN